MQNLHVYVHRRKELVMVLKRKILRHHCLKL